MLRELFHFLRAWLIATLFVFLACITFISVLIVGFMFITWSLPEVRPLVELFFGIRVLIAFSAFIGFCWAAAPDWDDPI